MVISHHRQQLRHKLSILVTLLIGLAAATPVLSQEVPDISMMKSLPIDLDASSSEFDRKNNRLLFSDLTIRQGPLKIDADQATASRLDFENTRWEFTGNVRIENNNTTANCDYADVLFEEHRIRSAIMQGQPAKFSQIRLEDGQLTQGHATVMEYDVDSGVISMTQDAWLSDGSNEVSGDRISYDLVREYIIAAADENGQVRMKIIPPEDIEEKTGVQLTP